MKILGNRVHLKPVLKIEEGGIILPERCQHAYDEKLYEVVAVGPGRKLKDGTVVPIPLIPGEWVICKPFHSHHMFENGERIVDAGLVEMAVAK